MPASPAPDTAFRRRCVAVLAAGALLPPVLAGCGSGDEPSEGKGGATRDVSAVARDRTATGGTLRWAVDAMPSTLNAFQSDAAEATDRIAAATLPALFTLDARGVPQANPDYLKSAEVTAREPQQTVVYTLADKARWNDGKAIGAGDFEAQWKALSGSDSAYWSARNAGYDRIHKIESGEKPRQVKVTFARPYSDWKSLFTPLYPRSVMGDPKAFNEASRTRLPAAAGPFQLADDGELGKKARTVTLERNPKWWGDRARLDSIVLTPVARGKRAKALAEGKLDLAEIEASELTKVLDGGRESGADTPPEKAAKPEKQEKPEKKADKDAEKKADKDADKDAEKDADADAETKPDAEAPEADVEAEADVDEQADGKSGKVSAKAAAKAAEAAAKAAEQRKNLRELTVRRALGPAYTQLTMNATSGPLRDERVRRAIARALDRDKLAAEAMRPVGLPGKPLGSHLRLAGQDGYHDSSAALGKPGTEAAAGLLASAGWKGGPLPGARAASGADAEQSAEDAKAKAARSTTADKEGGSPHTVTAPVFGGLTHSSATAHVGLLRQTAYADERAADAAEGEGGERLTALRDRADESRKAADEAYRALSRFVGGLLRAEGSLVRAKEGKELVLRMVLPAGPGSEQLRSTGHRIAYMLERVGVRTELQQVRDESYFADHIASGDFDLALFSWPVSAFPVTDARPVFAKPVPAPNGTLMIEQNYSRVGTDQIDLLFEQAANELDDRARQDLLRRIDARVWAVAGSVPLYQRPELVAVNKKLVNAGAFGFETPRYQDIAYRS
ncbi:ABC transporter family substrate-binding protein [Streptomyces durbertensis]|uniref:ABC transporter family substrate-binding protein n=1 Tax=Streptomyces durbertensis TaxID=2448886 RepID=A0ABR6EAW2_9ACTN|nr:ABC transporter family substrate-binding protein [Streptomyces durbertensis]MBB1242482.1 ABC transporter family substrate-binding protein [Streptomyces durbertensis]